MGRQNKICRQIKLFRADCIELNARVPWALSPEEAVGFSNEGHDLVYVIRVPAEFFDKHFTASGYGFIPNYSPEQAICPGKAGEIDLDNI